MATHASFLFQLFNFAATLSDALPASRRGWGASLRYAHPGSPRLLRRDGTRCRRGICELTSFLFQLFNFAATLSDALRFGAFEAKLEVLVLYLDAHGAEAGFIHLVTGAGR